MSQSMQATGRVRFYYRFLFASYRDTDWNATRDFVLLGKNGIIAACVGDDCIKIDRFKKREILTRTRRRYIFQNAVKTDRNAFLEVFFARFAWIYSEYDFARRNTRAEKTGSFASVVFLFFENAILVSIWRHVWTRFFKKEKKN